MQVRMTAEKLEMIDESWAVAYNIQPWLFNGLTRFLSLEWESSIQDIDTHLKKIKKIALRRRDRYMYQRIFQTINKQP